MFVIDSHMARYLERPIVYENVKNWISRIWSWRHFNERDFFIDSITLWGKGSITWRPHVYRGNRAYPNDVIAAMLCVPSQICMAAARMRATYKDFSFGAVCSPKCVFYIRACLLAIKIAILAWHVWPPYSFYMSFHYITGWDNSVKCLWMMINNSC